MQELTITDPVDILYPFSKEMFDNNDIYYHGTSSGFSQRIETRGWSINDQPYDIKDIQQVCKFFEELQFFDLGYSVLSPFTLGVNDSHLQKKRPSFTNNYWMARGFARFNGGETILALKTAYESFLEFIESDTKQKEHHQKLEKDYNYYKRILDQIKRDDKNYEMILYNVNRFSKALEYSQNNQFLIRVKNELEAYCSKYSPYCENVHGVVYAIEIQPNLFDNWSEYRVEDKTLYEEFFGKERIGPELIVAKISFPNGIFRFRPYSNMPLPLPWKLRAFKESIKDSYGIDLSIKNKYLD